MADGKPGRRPVSDETVAKVRQLLAAGHSERQTAAAATQAGLPVSASTVHRISAGEHCQPTESTSSLSRGETRLDHPRRCPNGHYIVVVPCRTCAAHAALLDRSEPQRPPPPANLTFD